MMLKLKERKKIIHFLETPSKQCGYCVESCYCQDYFASQCSAVSSCEKAGAMVMGPAQSFPKCTPWHTISLERQATLHRGRILQLSRFRKGASKPIFNKVLLRTFNILI